MGSNLNEYCLSHIFSFLEPHDLIHVSEVCRMWREVASIEWQKITEIDDSKSSFELDERTAIVISAKDAKKIVVNAAPYVKVLKVLGDRRKYFLFGNFYYKVEGRFKAATILEILILAGATEVTNAGFNFLPKVELIRLFLFANKVEVLSYWYSPKHHHRQIPTHGIEELHVNFAGNYKPDRLQVKSFEGHFPNLESLELEFFFKNGDNVDEMVSKIFPFFQEVTCLKLICNYESDFPKPCDILNHILLYSQLEELAIEIRLDYPATQTPDIFLTNLRTCCPKIQTLNINFSMDFNEFSLLSLMSLPELERFEIRDLQFDLIPMEFPEMNNLLEFEIMLQDNNPSVAGIFGAVMQMPKLETIVIKFTEWGDDPEYFSKQHQIQLICNIALAASSQGKDVLVTNLLSDKEGRELQIKRNVDPQALTLVGNNECQTIHLATQFENEEESFLGAREFVRNKLYRYHVIIS